MTDIWGWGGFYCVLCLIYTSLYMDIIKRNKAFQTKFCLVYSLTVR